MRNLTFLFKGIIVLKLTMLSVICYAQSNFFDWSFQTNGDVLGSFCAADNMIYFGSHDSIFYAIDTNGTEQWRYFSSYPIQCTPLIVDNMVCFNSGNRLIALNKSNGAFLWKHEPEEAIENDPIIANYATDLKSSSPVLNGATVYYGNEFGKFYGIDPTTGDQAYEYSTGKGYAINSTACFENNTAYFGDDEGYVYAINIDENTLLWEVRTNNGTKPYGGFAPVVGNLVLHDDFLYFGILNGEYQVLNKTTGAEAWAVGDMYGSWYSGIPVISEGVLYQGTSDSKQLVAFNAITGEQIWASSVQRGLYNAPIIMDNKIIVVSGYETYEALEAGQGSGRITVLDFDGNVMNRISLKASVFGSPLLSQGKIFFGSLDNKVYSISLNTLLNAGDPIISSDTSNIDLGTITEDNLQSVALPPIFNRGATLCELLFLTPSGDLPEDAVRFSSRSKTINAFDSATIKFKIYPAKLQNGDYTIQYTYTSNDTSTIYYENQLSFTIDLANSIQSKDSASSQWLVFPNPCSGTLYFKHPTKEIAEVQLFNTAGKLLQKSASDFSSTGGNFRVDIHATSVENQMLIYKVITKDATVYSGTLLNQKH